MAGLSIAEKEMEFIGATGGQAGHLVTTRSGQRFGVDVGASVNPTYAPGQATFQSRDGQTMTFGTVSTPDLARMQAQQAAAALRNSGIAPAQPQAAHHASSVKEVAGGLQATIKAATASAETSRADAVRQSQAPSGKGGGRGI